ncbi:MAG: serine protease [Acidimicrobiales bacterium]|nr:serine protease [Acidimicrobiales bacterium]
MMRTHRLLLALFAALALVVSACSTGGGGSDGGDDGGGGGGGDSSGAVDNLEDVKTAVIQIESQGSFAEPSGSLTAFEETEGVGRGSGFIIDPSGIAVTNNHVVTGSATLEVYVDGEEDPVNAKVLGVSECSDLAVIDLDGDGYPFLEWYDGDLEPGLEVRSAGFPLGDPEYTLTSGIVSKADADGDTNWASVDSVIEHDATIQPGNSGGPLVEADTGKVVAVNYAGGDLGGTGTSQFFAIGSDLAQETVGELEEGDVLSLGVNGQAVYDEEIGLAGIWVSSVDTNSPAGELGLQGGDVIERIEGLSMGQDGTMKDYCDVLRSHDASDKLAVQVLRFEDDVRLEGEFNGDELAEKESLGSQVEAETGAPTGGGAATYNDYVSVTDDSGTITVDVPSSWSDLDGAPIDISGQESPSLKAAPSLAAWESEWDAPGIQIAGIADPQGIDDDTALSNITQGYSSSCTDEGREDYSDQLYVGRIQYYSDCGGTGAVAVAIVAGPEDGSFKAAVLMQIVSQADLEALDQVIDTFVVDL